MRPTTEPGACALDTERGSGVEKAPASGAPTWVRPDFEEFVAARSSRLLRTAYLLTHDRGLAEDLVQTALSKAWFAWGRVDNDPEPYVRRILVNTYASWWRRRWNGEEPTDALPDTGSSGHDESSAARHDLWDAMARLPKRQRAVVVLRYFEDLSEAQAAEVLGCSVGTVKSQTSRALAKLRIDPALEPTDRPTAGPTDRPAAPATPEGTTR